MHTHTHTHKQCSNTVVQAKVKASTNVVKTIGRKKIYILWEKSQRHTKTQCCIVCFMWNAMTPFQFLSSLSSFLRPWLIIIWPERSVKGKLSLDLCRWGYLWVRAAVLFD